MDYNPKLKLDNFDAKTTYLNDYRRYTDPDLREKHTWPCERSERPSKPPPDPKPVDLETFQPWKKGHHIPFTLYVKPRPIIDTHPKTPFSQIEKGVDEGKEEAIKTRPRLYVSPSVSIDDVPDPKMRKLLIDYMYTPEWTNAVREAAPGITKRPTQNTCYEAGKDPVPLVTQIFPRIESNWRAKGKDWDEPQKRAEVDPTLQFWLKKEVTCGACVNPFKGLVKQEVKDEISRLIHEDKLRLAHDLPKPLYAGYKPMLSAGVPLSKVELPVTHPMLSATGAISQRYAEDKRANK